MPKDKEITEFSDKGSQDLTDDVIRIRAYQLYEQRGCEQGHDLDDWLQAEAEIAGKKSSTPAKQVKQLHKVVAA